MADIENLSPEDRARLDEALTIMRDGNRLINLVCFSAEEQGDNPPPESYKHWLDESVARLRIRSNALLRELGIENE